MKKVFITQQTMDEVVSHIADSGFAVEYRDNPQAMSPQELAGAVADCSGVLTLLTDRIDASLLESSRDLEVVANCAVGFDNVDIAAATAAGVMVTNTPDVLTDATADLAMALMLGAARRLVEGDAYMRQGRYTHFRMRQEQIGYDISGAALGIVGFGRIGKAVARRAHFGFGMTVRYYDVIRHLSEAEEAALGVAYVSFYKLLETSDYVSIHTPLTPETRHLFNVATLHKMKPTAILVNTARGQIIDEHALVDALRSGTIGGAGLDVYENEPQMVAGLGALTQRMVLLPHLGSATEATRRKMALKAADNLVLALRGQRPPNLVNREVAKRG